MTHRMVGSTRSRRAWALPLATALLAFAALGAPAAVGAAGSAEYRDCSTLQPAPGARLHRCSLPGLVIIGQDLHGIDFSKSDLTGANAGCDPDLPRTNLAGARIARAILVDALLCDAILTDADLHGSDFTDASFEDATLERCEPVVGDARWRRRAVRTVPGGQPVERQLAERQDQRRDIR